MLSKISLPKKFAGMSWAANVWVAGKSIFGGAGPEGASDSATVAASLKRRPDTNRAFFSNLLNCQRAERATTVIKQLM
jgi:hypothetical protein